MNETVSGVNLLAVRCWIKAIIGVIGSLVLGNLETGAVMFLGDQEVGIVGAPSTKSKEAFPLSLVYSRRKVLRRSRS